MLRALGKTFASSAFEIGRVLSEVKATFGRGENPEFLAWVKGKLGWSQTSVYRFLNVHSMTQRGDFTKLEKSDLDLSVLYLLAAAQPPPEVIDAIAERSAEGERLSHTAVKTMIADAHARDVPQARTIIETPTRYLLPVKTTITRETVIAPYYVPADQPAPAPRTISYVRSEAEDQETLRIQTASRGVLWNLVEIARALTDSQIRPIIAAWDEDDLERVREGIEAVNRLKAALEATSNVVRFPVSD